MTAIADVQTYRVTAPLVLVKGEQGSVAHFYEGDVVTPWTTADAEEDTAAPAELARLVGLGVVEVAV